MYKEIHLDAPNIGELEKLYLNKAIDSGYISSAGPSVSEFEGQCADYLHIKKAVTEKTRAIIPVHLYGNPCNMNEINRIAKKYNLYVIEDAAESLGAKYGGKFTGTLGDLGCFSFNGNKTITTGGGGMVAGGDVQRLDHIKFLIAPECYKGSKAVLFADTGNRIYCRIF
ncbi:MAG TPA: hypothetical protein ENG75_02090 [Nitrospirae bacterium]|nr:hypothetical protein [Nitrospirota bacterium]HDK16718.1 hypothetical protein [Nitrospirota bacterium]